MRVSVARGDKPCPSAQVGQSGRDVRDSGPCLARGGKPSHRRTAGQGLVRISRCHAPIQKSDLKLLLKRDLKRMLQLKHDSTHLLIHDLVIRSMHDWRLLPDLMSTLCFLHGLTIQLKLYFPLDLMYRPCFHDLLIHCHNYPWPYYPTR